MNEQLYSCNRDQHTLTTNRSQEKRNPTKRKISISPPRKSQILCNGKIHIKDLSREKRPRAGLKKNMRKKTKKKICQKSSDNLHRRRKKKSIKKLIGRSREYTYSPNLTKRRIEMDMRAKNRSLKPEKRLIAYGMARDMKISQMRKTAEVGFFKPKINSKSREIMKTKEKSKNEQKNIENGEYKNLKKKVYDRRKRAKSGLGSLSLTQIIKRAQGDLEYQMEEESKEEYISPYSKQLTLNNYKMLKENIDVEEERQNGKNDNCVFEIPLKSEKASYSARVSELKGRRKRNVKGAWNVSKGCNNLRIGDVNVGIERLACSFK